jgi:predicted HTH domain antitoxin
MTRQVVVEVPEEAMELFGEGPERFGRQMYEAAVVKWYDEGRITSGRGSELLGISRADFLELLAHHQVSPFQYSAQELKEEFHRG